MRLELLGRRHAALACIVAGLLLGPTGLPALAAGALLVVATVLTLSSRMASSPVWRGARVPSLAAGLALLVIVGGGVAQTRLAVLDHTALRPLLGRTTTARAVVLDAPRPQRFGGWSFPARLISGPGRGERIAVQGPARAFAGAPGHSGSGVPAAPPIGAEVVLSGRLAPLAAWQGFERVRGAHAALLADRVVPTGRRRGGAAGFVDGVRRRAQAGVSRGLPAAQAALARGMVLGTDDALDDTTRDEFRASGLSHLLAASGSNVALLALLAAAVGAALGLPLRLRLAAALLLVALYVPLAGGGASIVRAGVMGGAAIVAGLAGRPASRAYALLLAAAVTLVLNPRAVLDPGWQLSFAAVVAIGLLAARWRLALERRGVPRTVAELTALTAAATLGTAPLLAVHFGQLSLASLPANVLAAPAVAPVVWLGTLSATLGQLSVLAPMAGLVNALAALPLGFVGAVAHLAAHAPGASVGLALSPVAALGAYGLLVAILRSGRLRRLTVGAGLAALALAGWAAAHPAGPPRDLTVSFLDVGQGDATLLQHGRSAVLVDTGPPDGPILQRLRAAGARRLDLLVLTHAQADHEGMATRILRAVPVGAVLDGGDGVRSPERTLIERAAAARHVRRITPDAGQLVRAGPLALRILSPRAEPAALHAGADPNLRAIVAVARDGAFSMLLTADAESDVTAPLDLPHVDVLKVAHHGSDDPGLPAELQRLQPSLAAIEVGAHNTYGHPAPSTLLALTHVPRVVRTDRDGTVRLTVRDGTMRIRTHA